jgi:hypothetical protein
LSRASGDAVGLGVAVDDLDFEVPVGSLDGIELRGACGWSLERRPTVDHPATLRGEE